LCVFSLVAGGGDPHRWRRKTEKKKKTFPIHRFFTFISGGSGFTRRQWQWRVEQRAATVSAVSEGFPALFLNFWGFIL
jgi:hypothetical protein